MANAIDVSHHHHQTLTTDRPSEPEGPTCQCVDPNTKDRCGKRATRVLLWGGEDGGKTTACVDCASYYTALSHEHKCPGHVKVQPLGMDTLH